MNLQEACRSVAENPSEDFDFSWSMSCLGWSFALAARFQHMFDYGRLYGGCSWDWEPGCGRDAE